MLKIRLIFISFYLLLVTSNLYSSESAISNVDNIFFSTDRCIYVAGEKILLAVNFISYPDRTAINSHIAYVVLRNHHQKVVNNFTINLSDGKYSGAIALADTLSTGQYQLSVFTNYSRSQHDVSFISKNLLIVNRFDKDLISLQKTNSQKDEISETLLSSGLLKLETNKSVYGALENVEFSLSSTIFEKAIVNISVVPKRSIVESFLSIQEDIYKEKNRKGDYYQQELGGTIITGNLYNKYDKSPIEGGRLLLSTIDSIPNLKYTSSDHSGRFVFNLSYAYLGRNVFIMPDPATFTGIAEIVLDDKYKIEKPFHIKKIGFDSLTIAYILKSQNIVRVQKSYNSLTPSNSVSMNEDYSIPKIYSKPNFSYILSDYVKLDNFNEISREIIPYIRIRGKLEEQSIVLQNANTSFSFFNSEPIQFVNGLPIGKTSRLLNLGSDKIRKIEIVNRPWHYGELFFNGILSVVLSEMDDFYDFVPDNSVSYLIDSFLDDEFFNGNLQNEKLSYGNLPDFRQVLFWKPTFEISKGEVYDFSFSSSHLQEEYIIFISGYNEHGEFFWDFKTFEVRF